MNKPAFIVDGFTEKEILKKICPGSPVRRLDVNGKDVQVSVIVARIATLTTLMGGKYYPIIILIDKESRNITAKEFKRDIQNKLGLTRIKDEILIGIADRMIENWILADWKNFRDNSKTKTKKNHSSFEGMNGSSQIKKYLPNYQKKIDGVDLFVNSNPSEIYKNSESFRDFVEELKKIDCKWLKSVV